VTLEISTRRRSDKPVKNLYMKTENVDYFTHGVTRGGATRTTDYGSRISCLNLTSLFALYVFLLSRLTSGAFTIYFSTPTLRRSLNEHPVLVFQRNIVKCSHFSSNQHQQCISSSLYSIISYKIVN
jgi:hypothetical protein